MLHAFVQTGSATRPPRGLRLARTVAITVLTLFASIGTASAQLGPNLRPPGLPDDYPIDRANEGDASTPTSKDDARSLLSGAWSLNAESVVFSAAKKRQLIVEAPSTVHVITDRQITRFGWRTLADALRMVPGVQTRTWLAQYQSVMIRGLLGTEVNNTRILWLENGVPMNDVRDGGIWLDETYPTELIKRVEVVLGPGSSLYGTGAFQGVVNIFTKDPRDVAENGEYRLGFGAFRTIRTSAMHAAEFGKLGVLLFASANTTDGPGLISAYRLRERERLAGAAAVRNSRPPRDDAFDPQPVPVNSQREWQTVSLKMVYEPIRLSVGFKNALAGFDGAEFFPAERYRFNRRELSTELVFDKAVSDNVSVLALASYRFYQNDYKDYFDLELDRVVRIDLLGESVNDPRYPERLDEKVTFVTDQHKVFALSQVQWSPFTDNELIGGIGGRFEAINAPEFTTDKVNQQFINGSLFVQDEQRLFSNAVILTLGGRLDTHQRSGPQLSVRGAMLYKWSAWLLSRLSYGSAFREPAMSQLYIDHFNAEGNPELDAETLQNIELSTVARPADNVTLRLDAFATSMDQLILNQFDKSKAIPYLGVEGKFVSSQESEARILGFEASARADLESGLSFFAHYNFLDSRARRGSGEDFETLDYDAPHRVGVGSAYSTDTAIASLMVFFVSETTDSVPSLPGERTNAAVETVPAYVLIQPHARFRLPGGIGGLLQASYALSQGIQEAPNTDFYYEMLGVPVPRLTFMLGAVYPYWE